MNDCGHDHHSHIYHHFYGGDDGGGGGDGSGIKAFLCVVGGFLLMVLVFVGLGVEVDDVPAFLLVVVWIAITSGLVALVKKK